MKKNLNIIQIKGVKGLILTGMIACCLFAGFVVFPGWIAMNVWNYMASYGTTPVIGLFQGTLLWAILVTSYFIFRKDKVVVCMKSSEGLSEEELKTVFADMKRQAKEDQILQAMLKAKESELKVKSADSEMAVKTEHSDKM